MRFGSVCSGMEAASVAWKPLGWEAVWFSEIEPFCCSVLKHHYPGTPNLGDVRGIAADIVEAFGPIDVAVFGFPCQDLSVAGQRKGLKHDGEATRSGLFFDIMRVVERADPRWTVVENVPGLFSSNDGRDFALVVGTLAGAEFDVPEGGWQNTGVATGPKGLVEWSVLDAQWFGVPQRRRRVFLVRDSGDWRSRPPILFNAESLLRHPPPSRETGEGVAHSLARGACGSHGRYDPNGEDYIVPGPLQAHSAKHGHAMTTQQAAESGQIVAGCLNSGGNDGGFRTEPGEHIVATPLVPVEHWNQTCGCGHDFIGPLDMPCPSCHTIRDGVTHGDPIPFDTTQVTSPGNYSSPQPGDACHPLAEGGHPPAIAFDSKQSGEGGDVSPPLRALNHDKSHANAGGQVAVAYQCHGSNVGEMGHLRAGNQGATGGVPFVCGTLAPNTGPAGHDAGNFLSNQGVDAGYVQPSGMAVRRLTPHECELLQGFSGSYLSQVTYRKRCPPADGPMYRALGNSMAVPVMRWIGKRILESDVN